LHAGYLRLHTYSEYVIPTAFPLQQLLGEIVSILLYAYFASIVTSWVLNQI